MCYWMYRNDPEVMHWTGLALSMVKQEFEELFTENYVPNPDTWEQACEWEMIIENTCDNFRYVM